MLVSLDSEHCISFTDFFIRDVCSKLQSCPLSFSVLHALYTEN